MKIINKKKSILEKDTIFGDDVMNIFSALSPGSVDMIYGDPDYNVGIKYNGKSYTRDFNEYISWYIELVDKCRTVLKENGNIFLINYPKQNAYLRVTGNLDKKFARVHDYAWVYNTNIGHSPSKFTTAHRSILHLSRSKNNVFYKEAVAEPYQNPTDKRVRALIESGSVGRMPYSWHAEVTNVPVERISNDYGFEVDLVKNISHEKTEHACQIPQNLVKKLILATTRPRDTILVLFGGSGGEAVLAKQLGRHFYTAEIDKKYCKLIKYRLKDVKFGELLNKHD